jgi:HK97 family phage major capsid protein
VTGDDIGQLLAGINRLNETIQSSKAKDADGGRTAAAQDGVADLAAQIVALKEEQATQAAAQKAAIEDAVKATLASMRTPSMAGLLGQGPAGATGRMGSLRGPDPHPALKASISDYQAGEFLTALLDIHAIETGGIDFDAIQRGKAKLADLGTMWWHNPEGKATLGNTNAAGGYVLPNNLVDTVVKPETQAAVYQNLVTVRNGVNVRGVDQPYRLGAPTRMTFQQWGETKENVNETYGSYSAPLGTIARIMDIGKQYARFSGGAAEADVIDELTRAAILAENFYMLAGAGTGTGSSGDPTVGVYTALINTTPTYTTTGAPVAGTIAGSAAAQILAGLGALATRSRTPTAVVTDAATYYSLFAQGSDSAGFFMSELLGAGFQVGGDFSLRFRGIPIYFDANFNTNTATTKRAIVADWKVFKLYRGAEFRIDTSDVAGNRWDNNLIGFRGEEEIGFNANTGVAVGAAQLIVGVIP